MTIYQQAEIVALSISGLALIAILALMRRTLKR